MHPDKSRRLGARGQGPKEIRYAKWFNGFSWDRLESGKLDAPHRQQAAQALQTAIKNGNGSRAALLPDSYQGDTNWYSGFSSFFNTPRSQPK